MRKYTLAGCVCSWLFLMPGVSLGGADYVYLGDADFPMDVVAYTQSFILPPRLAHDGVATIMMRVGGVGSGSRSIYINPPVPGSCKHQANVNALIGGLAPTEHFDQGSTPFYHAFPATKLEPGLNTFMLCGSGVFAVRDIVLMYRTW